METVTENRTVGQPRSGEPRCRRCGCVDRVGWVEGIGWLCGRCANRILDHVLDLEDRILGAFGDGVGGA